MNGSVKQVQLVHGQAAAVTPGATPAQQSMVSQLDLKLADKRIRKQIRKNYLHNRAIVLVSEISITKEHIKLSKQRCEYNQSINCHARKNGKMHM